MGIVNVTPDSFSDGGRHATAEAAVQHGLRLVADGADILDVGGESPRPGATPVDEADELARVLPVVRELARQTSVAISIDTMKPGVARACLDAGAVIVNDVAGLRDAEMVKVVAGGGAGVVVMHMQGTPRDMQDAPVYGDVVAEVHAFFEERWKTLTDAGIDPAQICFDPGIGFGKSQEHNLRLLARLPDLVVNGRPICLGVSRKGTLGVITGRPRHERDAASLAVACFAVATGGAHVLRVHDARMTADAAKLWEAINS